MKVYMYGTNSLANSTEDSLILNQKVRIYRTYNNVLEGEYYPIFTLSSNKVKIENIQIELNTVATDYVERKEQTFTFPLGNEKLMLGDYLADDGIHHIRGQVVLNGTEKTLTVANSKANSTYFEYTNPIFVNTELNKILEAICNCLIPRTAKSLYGTDNIGFTFSSSGNFRFNLPNSIASNITELKNWLSNNNMIIEGILKQEIVIPYTSAQQTAYNTIKEAISYEGQTNISSNTIALFNVEAYQSTKLVLKEMATAIVALGGV